MNADESQVIDWVKMKGEGKFWGMKGWRNAFRLMMVRGLKSREN